MRGVKRPAGHAAALAQSESETAIETANRKGVRTCVECGATSTPQWREGPMGPKTLCNACGVRRQRLLRKQHQAAVGLVPTAPVAAVQARRRPTGRHQRLQALQHEEDSHYATGAGLGSAEGSEHSSDETALDWMEAEQGPRRPLYSNGHSRRSPVLVREGSRTYRRRHQHDDWHAGENTVYGGEGSCDGNGHGYSNGKCNEEECAAYDLLFFAGVDVPAGGPRDELFAAAEQQTSGAEEVHPGQWRAMAAASHHARLCGELQLPRALQPQPARRSEELYRRYYDCLSERAVGAFSGSEPAAHDNKRHKGDAVAALRAAAPGPSLSSTEDAADSRPDTCGPVAFAPTATSLLSTPSLPARPSGPGPAADNFSQLPPALGPAGSVTSGVAPAPAASLPPLFKVPPLIAACASNPAQPSLPTSLPLNISLPLPLASISPVELALLARLQADMNAACAQLRNADAACEAVGQVVAEQRGEAEAARDEAARASQQLAAGVRELAERYRLRDVLDELRGGVGRG